MRGVCCMVTVAFLSANFTKEFATVAALSNLSILVLAPYGCVNSDPGWKGGPAVVPAVRLAVDRINNRTDLLPGYRVQLLEGNSGCQHEPTSTHSFVSNVFYDNSRLRTSSHVVGVIGPACSESTMLLGKLGARDSISLVQISPSATSTRLTDTTKYRYTFRMLSVWVQYVDAISKLVDVSPWRNVALLYDNTRAIYRVQSENLSSKLGSKIGFDSAIDCTHFPLGIIEERFKIIILIAGDQLAREIMCVAYQDRKIIYPVYQWVIVGRSKDEFRSGIVFRHNGKLYNCTSQMMRKALEGTILTSFRLSRPKHMEEAATVDLSVRQYRQLYPHYLQEHLNELNRNDRDASYHEDAKDYAAVYYDATWALILALNATLRDIFPATLNDYTFGQSQITENIRQNLGRLKFEGITGDIKFRNTTQDSSSSTNIYQYIEGENTLVCVYDGTDLKHLSSDIKFVADVFHSSIIRVNLGVTVIVLFFAVCLTFYTASLHILFIVFQNSRSIKAASYTLSHFMFSGCYLLLLQVYLTVVEYSYEWHTDTDTASHNRDVAFGVICNVNEWLYNIGFSLIIGTLCGKLWRVYRIFNYFTTKSFLISDVTLTLYIAIIVGVTLVLLVLWTAFDPLLAVFERQEIQHYGDHEPIILVKGTCHCKYYTVWVAATYTVILLLLTSVVALSSLNRRISHSYFRTVKSVNLMVYMIAPPFFLGNGLTFLFQSLDIHYTYILWQVSLLSIVSLVCVFAFTAPAYSALRTVLFKVKS